MSNIDRAAEVVEKAWCERSRNDRPEGISPSTLAAWEKLHKSMHDTLWNEDANFVAQALADDEDDIHDPVADITDGTDEPAVHANHELMAAAPDLARTLAADTVEWAVMLTYGREDYIFEDWWYPTEYEAREALSGAKRGTPHLSPRLVARRVSAPWEETDE